MVTNFGRKGRTGEQCQIGNVRNGWAQGPDRSRWGSFGPVTGQRLLIPPGKGQEPQPLTHRLYQTVAISYGVIAPYDRLPGVALGGRFASQPPRHLGRKRFRADRLGQIIVHSGVDAALAVALERMGGDADDRHPA